jgi:hypothetical protein
MTATTAAATRSPVAGVAAGHAVQLDLVHVPPLRPVHRVTCPACGWVGYRRHPWSRDCPRCGVDASKLWPLWLAGCAPRPGRCTYLVHIWPPPGGPGDPDRSGDPGSVWAGYRHACHYLGYTTNLWSRWRAHLAGGYDPVTHKATGDGARLLAAALHHGCQIELVRAWYGSQARTLEQRLKQRRKPGSLRSGAKKSLRPLCPVCDPGALRRYRSVPDPTPPRPRPRPPRPPRFVPSWDAEAEWDAAFPHLAYNPDGADGARTAAAVLEVGGAS